MQFFLKQTQMGLMFHIDFEMQTSYQPGNIHQSLFHVLFISGSAPGKSNPNNPGDLTRMLMLTRTILLMID